jgi:hypothetical protein
MVSLLLLVASAYAVQHLTDGVPVAFHAKSGDVLFSFTVEDKALDHDLQVSVTPYGGWDSLELYMSEGAVPTPTTNEWKGEGWLFKLIVVHERRIKDQATYNILVKIDYECMFSISASLANQVSIGNVWSVSNLGSPGRPAHYVLKTDKSLTTEVFLLKHYGAVELTVSDRDDGTLLTTNARVDEGGSGFRSDWGALLRSRLDVIGDFSQRRSGTVPTKLILGDLAVVTLTKPPAGSEFRITVSSSLPSSFSLFTVYEGHPFVLQDGMQVPGSIVLREWDMYMFYAIETLADVIIIKLVTFTGDPDVYVSFDKPPSFADYTYKAEGLARVDNIVISRAARRNSKGWYYIGVYGKHEAAASTYHISASLNAKSFHPLLPSSSYFGTVDRTHLDFYFLETPPRADFDIDFILQSFPGNPELFVKLCKGTAFDCRFEADHINNPQKCKA